MDRIFFLVAVMFLVGIITAGCVGPAGERVLVGRPLGESRQVVVVTTGSWDATSGTVERFERASGGAWERVGESAPVVVGRSGLGWGSGLHPTAQSGPHKQEGDGRAPAGVFRLTGTFGYAGSGPGRMPYTQATGDLECVDDVDSEHYNRVIDRGDVDVDWSSHEEMRRDDDLYSLGVIVDHNSDRVPGDGSCIFLHVWSGPDSVTAGCSAMPATVLQQVAGWLDPAEQPVLVQMPESEYARVREVWALP